VTLTDGSRAQADAAVGSRTGMILYSVGD